MIINNESTIWEKLVNVSLYVAGVLLMVEILFSILIIVQCQTGIDEKKEWLEHIIERHERSKIEKPIELNTIGQSHYIFTFQDEEFINDSK